MTDTPGKKITLTPAMLQKVVNYYTAVKFAQSGRRRYTPIEHGGEERTQLKSVERLQAVAIGRDLERNNCKAITLIEQIKVLGFSNLKIEFSTSDPEWNKAAKHDFNQVFTRDCFYKNRFNLQEFAQLIESAKIREGDILIAFDDFLERSGKILVWEADQLVNMNEGDWNNYTQKNNVYGWFDASVWHPFVQESGVVLNQYGKVVAYNVSAKNYSEKSRDAHGVVTASADDCITIPTESAVLYSRRFRVSQLRGASNLLSVSEALTDIDEMIKSELIGAKTASQWVAFIKRAADMLDASESKTLSDMLSTLYDDNKNKTPSLESPAAGSAQPQAAGDVSNSSVLKDPEKLHALEAASGGLFHELAPGEEPVVPGFNRPNLNTSAFYDHQGDTAGASLGLAQGYSRLAVNSSYTSHRGETNLTYAHLKNRQKLAEWGWLDFIAEKRIEWAVENKLIPPAPENWKYNFFWIFPKPDFVDPSKESDAALKNQKLGLLDFERLLGPDWKERMNKYAEQINYAKSKGIPLAVFETVAGAIANQPNGENNNEF